MKAALHTLALTILLASTVAAQQNAAPSTKRLYIEPYNQTSATHVVEPTDEFGVYNSHDVVTTHPVSPIVTKDVRKQCPSLVTVIEIRDGADYVLHIAPGPSTLSRQDGSVAYTSKSKWKNGELAKDVCKFLGSQK